MTVPKKFQAFLASSPVENLDARADKRYIIENFLKKANLDAWQWMSKTYTREDIIEVVSSSQRLKPKDVYFWKYLYNLKEEEIACLQTKSRRTPKSSWAY